MRPLFELRMRFAPCVVRRLGTAKTQGGRRSRRPERVSGIREAREGREDEGRAGAAERETEKDAGAVNALLAAVKTAGRDGDADERKIGEADRRDAASCRRGWRLVRRVGSATAAILESLVRR